MKIGNRNYMNLLELPVLFYAACIGMYVTDGADAAAVIMAWTYVGLRTVHSLIHLTYNSVIHGLLPFAISNFVLAAIWIRFYLALSA